MQSNSLLDFLECKNSVLALKIDENALHIQLYLEINRTGQFIFKLVDTTHLVTESNQTDRDNTVRGADYTKYVEHLDRILKPLSQKVKWHDLSLIVKTLGWLLDRNSIISKFLRNELDIDVVTFFSNDENTSLFSRLMLSGDLITIISKRSDENTLLKLFNIHTHNIEFAKSISFFWIGKIHDAFKYMINISRLLILLAGSLGSILGVNFSAHSFSETESIITVITLILITSIIVIILPRLLGRLFIKNLFAHKVITNG